MHFSHACDSVMDWANPAVQRRTMRCCLSLAAGLFFLPLWGCADGDDGNQLGLDGPGTGGAPGTAEPPVDTRTVGAPDDDVPVTEWVPDCAVPSDQLQYVDSAMREFYLWSDELPELTLSDYETPEEVLEALRHEDDRWSAVFPQPEVVAFYAGRSVGLGFRLVHTWAADGTYRPRLSLVYEDSPAAAAALERGVTILEVNGVAVADIAAQGLWPTIMGADEVGVEVEFRIQRVDGTEQTVTVGKAELQRTSVSVTKVLSVGDTRVGYVMFEQFINPSRDALAVAFNLLKAEGATELVLDLRYNTGGLVDVAGYLGSLIAGPAHVGETFLRLDHNAGLSELNVILPYGEYPESIGFTRVAFLVSESTASSSEALINGLDPYIDVHLVGHSTFGKPVGSNGFEFCEKILQPITFILNNVNREANYFQGIAPDCEMADDYDHQLGDPQEARLAAALAWMNGNPCPADITPNSGGVLALPGAASGDRRELVIRGSGVDGYFGIF